MSDIVERLKGTGAERQRTTAHDTPGHYLHVVAKISNADGRLMDEAADEITRLRAKVEKLKAALEGFVCDCEGEQICIGSCLHKNARAALAQPQEGEK